MHRRGGRTPDRLARLVFHHADQVRDLAVRLDRMAESQVRLEAIAVAEPDPVSHHESAIAIFQIKIINKVVKSGKKW